MALSFKKLSLGKLLKKKSTNSANQVDAVDEGVTSKKKKRMSKKVLRLFLIVVGSLVVVFLTTIGVGIYAYNWEDSFTKKVTNILPYPAAFANGHVIFYGDYLDQLDLVKTYYGSFKGVDFTTEEGKTSLNELRSDTVSRLVENELMQAEAADLGITVGAEELETSFNELITSSGGESSLADVLQTYYGLTTTEFKNTIYKITLLEQKLTERFAADEGLNTESKAKADEVLAKVKAGEDFATLATQYSQDTSASEGGNIGLIAKGESQWGEDFDNAAFALEVGQTSEIVKTIYGYHIIKVTDEDGEKIQVSHILIKTIDFSTWLTDAVESAKVTNWVKNAQ